MRAILTKYLGPTNCKGARIKAYDNWGNSATVDYDYSLSGKAVHEVAARQLADVRGWKGELVGGEIKGGYAFVITPPIKETI